ncbi:MAG: Fic family protein [Nanoarchaeota archaeon]
MAYTEIKQVKSRKYSYRVQSVRNGKEVNKKRVYLGVDLNEAELIEKEKEADKKLNLLSTLLSNEEEKELHKLKKLYLSQSKENLENRYEAFISLFTYDSTNIEGNTLTLQETSQLLFENITPRKSLREINEVVNHKKAFDYLLEEKEDVSKKIILKLHELVTKDTLKEELLSQVGKYRKLQVFIRGVNWLPPKPEEVSKEMQILLSWYSKNKNTLHPLILTAYFHSAFETIHPFIDGNGRVGRLLMNFILRKNKYPMINIPNKSKYIYYAVLESAQVKGDLRPLVKFLFDLMKQESLKF